MKNSPIAVELKDYQLPDFFIPETYLEFELGPQETVVRSRLTLKRNPEVKQKAALALDGDGLSLKQVLVDGQIHQSYREESGQLILEDVPDRFILEIENTINPELNKTLEGLYYSHKIYCTQNEPEGFRKITYYLDRSDVMSIFTTKITGPKSSCPVLLSNGDLIEKGQEGDKHWALWKDPHRKPSYLFALVAGKLGMIQDHFKTMNGREVTLQIFCDPGNESRCSYAMTALKNAMKWDEEVYGLEYDLDTYMIVAVDSFNMGAMENKGLNIFNSAYVLADPETATDDDFQSVEGVIAHEYFHNWTGNRITLRDWFQLTLKEGLTVFRDQEFSADMQSAGVKRIEDVMLLQAHQFPEDRGPMAHPIRPDSYIEINNFYTATVYHKGAEVIRMIYKLLGAKGFFQGMKKYVELYDGKAVTCDDFLFAMSNANNFDLTQFKNWYFQAGTPKISVTHEKYDGEFKLTIKQSCAPIQGQPHKKPFLFPLEVALIGENGVVEGSEKNLIVSQEVESFSLPIAQDSNDKVVLSLNRSFSAPIIVEADESDEDLYFLMAHESDPYGQYQAGQKLGERLILDLYHGKFEGKIEEGLYLKALHKVAKTEIEDLTFKSYLFNLPSIKNLSQTLDEIDFRKLIGVRRQVSSIVAKELQQSFLKLLDENQQTQEFSLSREQIGKRTLKNKVLGYLMEAGEFDLVYKNYQKAQNMTDKIGTFKALMSFENPYFEPTKENFFNSAKDNQNVLAKWLMALSLSRKEGRLEWCQEVEKSPSFDSNIPNLFRALVGGFMANLWEFHNPSGAGYEYIKEKILEIDPLNPSMGSRLAKGFDDYSRLGPNQKEKMKKVLEEIVAFKKLSKNTYEIISKTLKST